MPSRNPTCFVIMPFAEPFNGYYHDIIAPAIEDADLKPIRGDEIRKPGAIADQIWNELKESAICVADLSTGNDNVMYELGLAHALRTPVVQIARKNTELPFDLQSLRHIFYDPGGTSWWSKLGFDLSSKHDWKHEFRGELADMLRAARDSPEQSTALDAPKNFHQMKCRGRLTELSLCSKSKLKPIGNDEAIRTYSPLENVIVTTTDNTAKIEFAVEVKRRDGSQNPATLSGSGPLSKTRKAYLSYTFEAKHEGDMKRSSMGVLVLDLSTIRNYSGLWATADNDEDDFVVGLINLEVLGAKQ